MKQVELHIDLASDGSGWAIAKHYDTREAYIWKEPSETYNGMSYHLIVPLTEQEEETFFHKLIIENDGVKGLKVTNVNEDYFDW